MFVKPSSFFSQFTAWFVFNFAQNEERFLYESQRGDTLFLHWLIHTRYTHTQKHAVITGGVRGRRLIWTGALCIWACAALLKGTSVQQAAQHLSCSPMFCCCYTCVTAVMHQLVIICLFTGGYQGCKWGHARCFFFLLLLCRHNSEEAVSTLRIKKKRYSALMSIIGKR